MPAPINGSTAAVPWKFLFVDEDGQIWGSNDEGFAEYVDENDVGLTCFSVINIPEVGLTDFYDEG